MVPKWIFGKKIGLKIIPKRGIGISTRVKVNKSDFEPVSKSIHSKAKSTVFSNITNAKFTSISLVASARIIKYQ